LATLPTSRPSVDTYGPSLVNDQPVADRTRELDATSWNAMRDDVAAMGAVVPFAVLRIDVSGGVAALGAKLPSALTSPTLTYVGTGNVKVTISGPVPVVASACAINVGANVAARIVSISGQDITIQTFATVTGTATDAPFVLLVF